MYLFFIRAFNDIDHITPIVWKMINDGYPVSVYCLNPEYDIQDDYRLSFLRANGVKVDYLYNASGHRPEGLHRLVCSVMFRSYRIHKQLTRGHRGDQSSTAILGKFAREIGKLSYAFLKALFYRKAWALDFFKRTDARVLCFDHIRPRQYVVGIMLHVAKEKGIPTIAFPHGVFIYLNDLIKEGATDERGYDKYNQFDYTIIQNRQRRQYLMNSGVHGNKIYALGSARYCDEWMTQNRQILPRMLKTDQPDNKLKVVFMTTRFAFRIDVKRMLETFDILSRLDDIEVLVKPHTRTGKEAGFYDDIPLKNVADISSVELCEWADVMLVIASSILIEALVQEKPVLYLKYLHGNTTLYEKLGACWQINNEAELKKALLSLRQNKETVPYSSENVQNFLSEIIYGGQKRRTVLEDYQQFVLNCNQKAP